MPAAHPNDAARRDRSVERALFLLVLGAYAYFFNGGGWNQNSHLDLTRAIVERGTLAIDAYADNTRHVSQSGGHVYSNKSPGLSLLAAVPYGLLFAAERAGGVQTSGIAALTVNAWLCTVATCGLLGAVIPVALYRHARRGFGLPPRWSAAIALAAALGTPLWPYATMLYLHVPSAALLLIAVLASGRSDRRAPAVAGGAAAAAGLLNYLCLPLVPVIVARVVWNAANRRRASALAVAAAFPPLGLLAAYQALAFGSVFRSSFHGVSEQFLSSARWLGILGAPSAAAAWGVTFSPYRGLFAAAPVLVLALAGAVQSWRRRSRRGELALIGLAVAVSVGFNVCFNGWPGGWAFGPRYLVPIVPLLAVAAMHVAGRRRRTWIALAGVSVAVSLAVSAVSPQVPPDVAAPLTRYVIPLLIRGRLGADLAGSGLSAMDGHVSVNRQTVDEAQPFAKFPPGSAPAEWASFNLGEPLVGAGSLASLLPLLLWLAGGVALLSRLTAPGVAAPDAAPRPPVAATASGPQAPDGQSGWWRQLPRPVLITVGAAWAVRALFLAYNAPISDEYLALRAAGAPVVARYFGTTDWAERWSVVKDITTGDRPLWAVSELLWGRLLPSDGAAAHALSLLAALATALVLTAAARRLYGRDEAGLVLVLASLSPLLLYYSVSVMAPALCAMWVSAALLCLASPGWRLGAWLAGGLCLGLAFGTHIAAGAPALGLAVALAIAATGALRDRALPTRERVRRGLVLPLAGTAAATLPLGLIARWAHGAGDSYLGRLVHHENFGFDNLGPRGMWLRQLFELDPVFELGLVVIAGALLLSGTTPPRRRAAVGAAIAAVVALLAVSLRDAPVRAAVSLALFAAIGVAVWRRGWEPRAPVGERDGADGAAGAAPLTPRNLAAGAAAIAVLFTAWRAVSAMPRLVFPSWPIFLLVLVGVARTAIPSPVRRWVRPAAAAGCVLFALAACSLVCLRSIPARADAALAAHPGWRRLRYEDLWKFDDRRRAGGWLATRAVFDVEVVSGAPDLDPICTYEEEPYKVEFMSEMVRDFGLEDVITGHQVPWAQILFAPGPTVPTPAH
ncbi:MAG TPA: hypothetical protein VLW17_10610 [Thermoanaerobaculaceae bacterium]|nr:hypothetical protein [Thermoanaerobaculaceae bacterium]